MVCSGRGRPTATTPNDRSPAHRYDLGASAAAYAPVMGILGALCVPALILTFSVRPKKLVPPIAGGHAVPPGPYMALAAGLLVLALLASFIASLGFASLAGCRADPPILVGAGAFFALPFTIPIVAVIGAFDLLAWVFLSSASSIVAVLIGLTSVFLLVLNASHFTERRQRDFALVLVMLVAVAFAFHHWLGWWRLPFGSGLLPTDVLVGGGVFLVFASALLGLLRLMPRPSRRREQHLLKLFDRLFAKVLKLCEAYGTVLALSSYVVALILLLPEPRPAG